MNWATPCAPAGLTAAGRNELSRQMSLVKKATGSPSALAEVFDDPAQGRERVVGLGARVGLRPAPADQKRKRGEARFRASLAPTPRLCP